MVANAMAVAQIDSYFCIQAHSDCSRRPMQCSSVIILGCDGQLSTVSSPYAKCYARTLAAVATTAAS